MWLCSDTAATCATPHCAPLHCTGEGEGVTHLRSFLPSGSLMFWPTRPAAWRHRNSVAKTAACGASKSCKHPPASTRPESHLFHDKTTCNLTGARRPMDSRLPLPTAPALGGVGCAPGVFMRAQASKGAVWRAWVKGTCGQFAIARELH